MSYDVSNVETKQEEYELIPEGNYTATVESVEKGTTSTGKEKVDIRYKLEEVAGKLFDSPLMDFVQNTLDHFEANSVDDLLGKTAKIKCYHKEYQGKMYAKVGVPRPLIKSGEIVKVSMKIIPGGLGDGQLETQSNANPNNRYLKTILTVVEGEYTGNTIFFNVMCASDSSKTLNFGLQTMKRINLSGDLRLDEKNLSAEGLDNAIFYVKVGIEISEYGKKNVVKKVIIEGEDSLGITKQAPASETDIDDEIPF